MDNFEIQTERNLIGIELEKQGKVDEAIKLYEQNIGENFVGSHPYMRLAIIYRKRKQVGDEIRVLKKAAYVFKNLVDERRLDRTPKLEKFKKRLSSLIPKEEIEKLSKEIIQDKATYEDDPIELLKIRYAKGEVTKDEYEQIKKDIEG